MVNLRVRLKFCYTCVLLFVAFILINVNFDAYLFSCVGI